MAAGRHIEICKNLNNSRTVRRIVTKFCTFPGMADPRNGGPSPFALEIQLFHQVQAENTRNLNFIHCPVTVKIQKNMMNIKVTSIGEIINFFSKSKMAADEILKFTKN